MKNFRIHYFQHEEEVSPGYLKTWAETNNAELSSTRFDRNEVFPPLDSFDLLVILGGTMNVNDIENFPFLKEEKEFVLKAIKSNKKVLGICLGGQMIASVLDAAVYENTQKEIGWFPITFTGEAIKNPFFRSLAGKKERTVFQWHGDVFNLPEGAVQIASNSCSPNQAFVYNDRVVALQFHPEMTEESVPSLIEYGKDELAQTESRYVQNANDILNGTDNIAPNNAILKNILDVFVQL